MQRSSGDYIVPFHTPVDYFNLCDRDPKNFPRLRELVREAQWTGDTDLHIYPYVNAEPAMLSAGCPNKCSFCPTYKAYGGRQYFGDYEKIIPLYSDRSVHFMDENFFRNPDIVKVLTLLKKYHVTWLCLSDFYSFRDALDLFGEKLLWDSGLRVVEIGLENVALMMKVKERIRTKHVQIAYLNMTFLPGETLETISANARWMKYSSLRNPIHYSNYLWYSPGQYYYPPDNFDEEGIMLEGRLARVAPTFVPSSFLNQSFVITDLERINFYAALHKMKKQLGPFPSSVEEFINGSQDKAAWLAIAARVDGVRGTL